MIDRRREEPERRPQRLAGSFGRGAGTVAMLIAAVLLTQAGLVYVAVDQIGSSDEPMVIQPAQSPQSPRSPISVEADPRHRLPAPVATRVTDTVEAESPEETGVDLAAERAQPQGIAPPFTGTQPPSGDVRSEPNGPAGPGDTPVDPPGIPAADPPADPRVDPPADPPADDETETAPGSEAEPSETRSDARDPHGHQDSSAEPPAEDHETQHGPHGHGAHDHEPPGQGSGGIPGSSGDGKHKGNGGN